LGAVPVRSGPGAEYRGEGLRRGPGRTGL